MKNQNEITENKYNDIKKKKRKDDSNDTVEYTGLQKVIDQFIDKTKSAVSSVKKTSEKGVNNIVNEVVGFGKFIKNSDEVPNNSNSKEIHPYKRKKEDGKSLKDILKKYETEEQEMFERMRKNGGEGIPEKVEDDIYKDYKSRCSEKFYEALEAKYGIKMYVKSYIDVVSTELDMYKTPDELRLGIINRELMGIYSRIDDVEKDIEDIMEVCCGESKNIIDELKAFLSRETDEMPYLGIVPTDTSKLEKLDKMLKELNNKNTENYDKLKKQYNRELKYVIYDYKRKKSLCEKFLGEDGYVPDEPRDYDTLLGKLKYVFDKDTFESLTTEGKELSEYKEEVKKLADRIKNELPELFDKVPTAQPIQSEEPESEILRFETDENGNEKIIFESNEEV